MRSLGPLLLLVTLVMPTHAFQNVRPTARRHASVTLAESRDDEIAELEEKLKRLKEEKVEEELVAGAAQATEEEDIPLDMFLTEQWKEQDAASSEDSGGLMNIVYAIGAAAIIVLFSQVPIGQEDLSKYSVGNNPSAEQIDLGDLNRARRAGDL